MAITRSTAAESAPAADTQSAALTDRSSHTSRRTLLGAGLGALVAAVAGALGRPHATRAADDAPLLIGQITQASRTSGIINNVSKDHVFVVESSGGLGIFARGGEYGIWGETLTGGDGVTGRSVRGNGVKGTSDSGIGVQGRSNTEKGVYGYSNSGPAVYGYSGANHALWGYSDAADGFGMFGQAKQERGVGVVGQNLAVSTIGLLGAPKKGVEGRAPNAIGFVGVEASAPEAATALNVIGKAAFSRSGKASVPAGRSFVLVTVPGELTAASLVLATPMLNRAGVYVQSAVPNPATGQIRINLNKVASSSSSTPIAWMVLS